MVRLAVGQVPQPGDVESAVRSVAELALEASSQRAEILLLPECFLGGYGPHGIVSDPAAVVDGLRDPRLEPLRGNAQRTDLQILVGAALREKTGVSNALLRVGREGIVDVAYRKTHLWATETEFFTPGTSLAIWESAGVRIGLGICYDAGFPEFAQTYAEAGVDVLAFSSAFAAGGEERRYWIYHPARALETSAYVLVSNVLGSFDGREFVGGSGVWGPDGQILTNLGTAPGVAIVDLDPAKCQDMRAMTGYAATRTSLSPLGLTRINNAPTKGQ
jgi:predicted amidohydrolase